MTEPGLQPKPTPKSVVDTTAPMVRFAGVDEATRRSLDLLDSKQWTSDDHAFVRFTVSEVDGQVVITGCIKHKHDPISDPKHVGRISGVKVEGNKLSFHTIYPDINNGRDYVSDSIFQIQPNGDWKPLRQGGTTFRLNGEKPKEASP